MKGFLYSCLFAAVLIAMIGIGVYSYADGDKPSHPVIVSNDVETDDIEVERERLVIRRSPDQPEHVFYVETAVTGPQKQKGLMFREHMDDDHGMLFVFPVAGELSFWMRNTLIPLDIIFIKANGEINHVHENAQPHDETFILSKGVVSAALEINGGMAKTLGISKGDKVYHENFGNTLAE